MLLATETATPLIRQPPCSGETGFWPHSAVKLPTRH